MTGNKEIYYWRSNEEWYEFDETARKYVLTDKAPERAIKSYELMQEKARTGAL